MQHIFTALIPIFLLIVIGYFFKKLKFPSNDFWNSADKLTYFVLMPSLLIYKLSTSDLSHIEAFDFVIVALLSIVIVLFISMIINIKTKTTGASFTSVVQGAVRFNTYVFLALISAIFSDSGIALAALLISFAIPLINFICITIFAIYANNEKVTFLGMVKSIVTNPLIVACAIGGSINYFDINITSVGENVLKILSASALPMGLLSIGFSLDLSSIKEAKFELILSLILKLILMPLIMYLVSLPFGIEKELLIIIIIFAAMPTAPSSFILARQLKGDSKLMASIITLQTIISLFSISFILGLILK